MTRKRTGYAKRERQAQRLGLLEPRTPEQLHRFVRLAMGLKMPHTPIAPGSSAPFDYLTHAYFEPTPNTVAPVRDAVVWANRGGGKTMLGAAATLLDLLFKPGIQVRILGGSMEQSSKMFGHLVSLLDRPWFRCLLDGEPTQRRVALINGSKAEMLAGSQRSVRGVRVHKLRCDEVEEFDADIWEAAQMVTRSGMCGNKHVHGAIEAMSTMHRPFGLMAKITSEHTGSPTNTVKASRLFKWSAIDVIERCPTDRACEGCVLWDDCRGLAKQADGFVPVDDLVQQWRRTSRRTWAVEMMCQKPEVSDCVYPEFDPARHVKEAALPQDDATWIGGMDFGLRNPTVMLWASVDKNESDSAQQVVHIMDEYVRSGAIFDQHLTALEQQDMMHGRSRPAWIGVDPAGNQRNSHTGISDVQAMRKAGYTIRSRHSRLRHGIECIRRRLDHGLLYIHPRCRRLIEAIRKYHFDVDHLQKEDPVKDGPDHLCDALRYMIINLEAGTGKVKTRDYRQCL